MVKITEELIRKKAEHNECIIGTLEELSLHQEDVDKIENINNWCKELQILYLQANLISKIENLNKLKKLQYLNLALNNIEKIENLNRCESLEKLDLTLNFIGDLESVCSLKDNIHLRELFLTGNPCTDYNEYRNYVVAQLPQLGALDNVEISKSERIKANQIFPRTSLSIQKAQLKYFKFREEQKTRLSDVDMSIDDETFWKSTSENAPETRTEITRRTRLARGKDAAVKKEQKALSVFTKDGKPLNINQAKIKFKFDDSNPKVLILDVSVYKHLDTNYIEVDLEPIFVKILIKGKVFQFVFPEEIYVDRSVAERSQITGNLVLTMPRVNYKPRKVVKVADDNIKIEKKNQYLEVEPKDDLNFADIVKMYDKEKFVDNSDVPPLEYG